jgi:CRISPR-associated protein Csm4
VEGDPPFLLTSAFPRAGDVRFYPMPVSAGALFAAQEDGMKRKQLKRTRFLSERLFLRVLQGEKLDEWWPGALPTAADRGLFLQHGTLWMTREEVALLPKSVRVDGQSQRERPIAALAEVSVMAVDRIPHVAVDRVRSASDIYFVGRTFYAQECGLWFGVQWRHAHALIGGIAARDLLDWLLQILGDEGVGGKRSSGSGHFSVTHAPDEIEIGDLQPGAPAWLLSRVSPADADLPGLLQGEGAMYGTVSVAGWMVNSSGRALRRKRVTLLQEGSWLTPEGELFGRLADVRPAEGATHAVYRYGLGLGAGIGEGPHHE